MVFRFVEGVKDGGTGRGVDWKVTGFCGVGLFWECGGGCGGWLRREAVDGGDE